MGGLLSACCGGGGSNDENYEEIQGRNQSRKGKASVTPDPEERRRQVAEAAEKRRLEAESRGVKDVEAVRRMKQRSEQREQAEEAAARAGGGNDLSLKWSMS